MSVIKLIGIVQLSRYLLVVLLMPFSFKITNSQF